MKRLLARLFGRETVVIQLVVDGRVLAETVERRLYHSMARKPREEKGK